jgi:hypothetical protein
MARLSMRRRPQQVLHFAQLYRLMN